MALIAPNIAGLLGSIKQTWFVLLFLQCVRDILQVDVLIDHPVA